MGSEGKPVGAVVSATAILRYLNQQPDGAVSAHVARDLGLNPSTCFNILKTLAREGLVVFDEGSKAYRLGLGLLELASGALDQVGYISLIRPDLEAIAARWQVSVTLWLRISASRVMLIDRAASGSVIEIHMRIGQRLPIMVGALGRCFAAYSGFSPLELKRLYAAVRSDAPIGFKQFQAEVEDTRAKGFAVDEGHFVRGVTTISSPILDRAGRPILAISTVGLSAQFPERTVAMVGEHLREVTRRIGRGLADTAIGSAARTPTKKAGHGLQLHARA